MPTARELLALPGLSPEDPDYAKKCKQIEEMVDRDYHDMESGALASLKPSDLLTKTFGPRRKR